MLSRNGSRRGRRRPTRTNTGKHAPVRCSGPDALAALHRHNTCMAVDFSTASVMYGRGSLRPVFRHLIQRGTFSSTRPAITSLHPQIRRNMSSSVARPSSLSIHFDSVIINEDATGSFFCDEEPHMLGPERGPLGYYPLQLGQVFHHDITKQKYEIVRKLGWGQHSSVWLARIVRCDSN